MEIGMNLPVMAPGLNRDAFLSWCERIDAGFFASIAAGERISFYNPDMTAALAAASALTKRVKVVSGVFVPMLHHPVMLELDGHKSKHKTQRQTGGRGSPPD